VDHVLSCQSQGKAKLSPLTEDEGCSGCPDPSLSSRDQDAISNRAANVDAKMIPAEYYEMQCP